MLIELGLVEQRHQAILEVLSGQSVTAVARRYGVARQTLHAWLRAYGSGGLAGLVDRSCRPASCPHQMPAAVEAKVIALRVAHPGWGPRTIGHRLRQEGISPPPGRSSIYRCLVRHQLIEPVPRKRRRGEYRRWERSRSMELWQLDVMGGVKLTDGREAKLISGIDDHSRFCVSAMLVYRATARPVCEALLTAMGRYGIPEQILTDNGKVFTGRFGAGSGEVLFDRICRESGVHHLLTAPHSPTTTGKVERFHKTVRAEFLAGKSFATLEQAQVALDAWVASYNAERPHQGIGMVAPAVRFGLAQREPPAPAFPISELEEPSRKQSAALTRCVHADGKINLGGFAYHVGSWLAGQTVEVSPTDDGLLEILHRGVLVAAHARRRPLPAERALPRRSARPRPASSGLPVLRMVDRSGGISFAGTNYRVGNPYRLKQVEVRVVGETVQIAFGGKIVRTHVARHERSKEHGAFATPRGRPRRINSAAKTVTKLPEPECQTGTGT